MQVLLSAWSLETGFAKLTHYIAYGFYWLIAQLSNLCNIIIKLVRALAGIETYWYNGSMVNPNQSAQGDVVINFLQEQGLINVFISLFVLAIVLLFIVTFVAVIKSEWSQVGDAKGNNKFAVISKSIRALINFVTVPVVAILGIIVGNELLKAVDGATHSGQYDYGISNIVLQGITENASWVYIADSDSQKIINNNAGNVVIDGETYRGIYSLFVSSGQYDEAAISKAFVQNLKVPTDVRISVSDVPWLPEGVAEKLNEKIAAGEMYFNYQDVDMMSIFYKLGSVDYIVGFIVLYVLTSFLFSISFGLVKRIYTLSVLLLISPPVVAVTPLDSKALERWRSAFLKNLLSIYGPIVGCNLFFILIPYVRRIQLFKPTVFGAGVLNYFVTMLFITAGASFVKDFSKMITDIIGGGDLHSESVDKNGNSLWTSTAQTAGKAISTFAGAPTRAVSDMVNFGKTAKYEGWGKALGGIKDNAIKKSGFLQGLTGATVGKDGKVEGAGSTFWKPVDKSTKEAKEQQMNAADEAGRNALSDSANFLQEEQKGYNAEMEEIAKREEERITLSQTQGLSQEQQSRLDELNKSKQDDLDRKQELQQKLDQNKQEQDALSRVSWNGKRYVDNTPKGVGKAKGSKSKKQTVQEAQETIARVQARKDAAEAARREQQQQQQQQNNNQNPDPNGNSK